MIIKKVFLIKKISGKVLFFGLNRKKTKEAVYFVGSQHEQHGFTVTAPCVAFKSLKRCFLSAPQPLRGKNTVDLIVDGSVLELRHRSDPLLYWPVRVVRNVGGRLRLRPVGLTDDHRAQDVWLFYLDVRLRPLGWALENSLALEPPAGRNPVCCFMVQILHTQRFLSDHEKVNL